MFRLLALVYTLVLFLALVLEVVLEFDLRTSPVWQLAVYHLMLLLSVSTPFVLSVNPGSALMGWKLRWGLVAAAVFLVAATAWLKGWIYHGPRAEALMGLALVFIGSWAILTVFAYGVRGMMLFWGPLVRHCLSQGRRESL